MNVPAKALIGLGVAGTVGGAGYAISTQFATENISKKLTEEGYRILDETENTEWALILTSYLATVNTKDSLKFKDFEIKEKEVEKLKQACKKALNNPSTDKDSYEKAEHWCTVPRTLKTLLEKDGYTALSTKSDSDADDNIDKDEWNKKLDDHVKDEARFKNKKFEGDSNIKTTGGAATKEKQNRNAIRKQCDTLNKKKHYETDIKDNLEKAKLWCAVHKTVDS